MSYKQNEIENYFKYLRVSTDKTKVAHSIKQEFERAQQMPYQPQPTGGYEFPADVRLRMEIEKDLGEEIRLDKLLRELRPQLFESQPKLTKAAKREKVKADREEILNKSHNVPFEKRSLLLTNLLKLKLLRPQM